MRSDVGYLKQGWYAWQPDFQLEKAIAHRVKTEALARPVYYLFAITSPVSIAQIRRLAFPEQKDEQNRYRFEAFFRGQNTQGLGDVLAKIGEWCGPRASYDLPLVIQTSIARDSPDVYAFLLWLADKALRTAQVEEESLGKLVQGLITTLHWFAIDKRKAVTAIAARLDRVGTLTRDRFKGILTPGGSEEDQSFIRLPLSVLRFEKALPLPSGEPDAWGWWTSIRYSDHDIAEREAVERVINNRELLLYAQRTFLQRRFSKYDPADEETWAQHNRPWDFDHILPQAAINRRDVRYKEVVKEWALRSVSNLRMWPMEENRSDQNISPEDKIGNNGRLPRARAIADSFLTKEELSGFSEGYDFTQQVESNAQQLEFYIKTSRARVIRIYQAWYDPEGLDIGYLVDPAGVVS